MMSLRELARREVIRRNLPGDSNGVREALIGAGVVLGNDDLVEVTREVLQDINLFGALTPFVQAVSVTDVLVNSETSVWIDGHNGLREVQSPFASGAEVKELAQRLAAAAGRRLDDAAPWCDGLLAGGVRLHAVLSPLTTSTAAISLRIPSRSHLSLDDLVNGGSISAEGAHHLRAMVQLADPFLVIGPTGSGKTTVLAALMQEIPADQRLLVVEDTSEIRSVHPQTVSLCARTANAEGVGAVSLRTLVRQTLRMRPDRIIVGEVRGEEIVDFLLALSTGHGGACTLHAHDAAGALERMRLLLLLAGVPRAAVDEQIGSALRYIVTVARVDGVRVVQSIDALSGGELRMVWSR